ncbi:MAG: hypothetical protein M3Q69_03480 [Acidobacteriota bacterium]|nr:hypothetical protein [Acidobacteriota bacterium]
MTRKSISLLTATLAIAAFFTATGAAAAQHIPNSVKYRDTGVPNAHGRSGSAAITARALLNRDGSTDLDVTTGDFDGGAARGTIDKLQLKLPTGTRNFNSQSSPNFSLHLADHFGRHAKLQVQTNVRGIDGARTDVVTVEEIVKLRPDAAAIGIDVPERVYTGVPTMINAVVAEHNGDTGARANCVLSVDGHEVDRANGIWIDAGDAVTCGFDYTFPTTGTKSLQVRVDSVSPADWDTANNSISQSVRVVSPIPEWIASAHDRAWSTYNKIDAADWQFSETSDTGTMVGASFLGLVKQSALDFDSVSVSYKETSGGTTFADIENIPFTYEYADSLGACKQFDGDGVIVRVCNPALPKNWPYDEGPTDLISINAARVSMDITYASHGRQLRRDYDTGEEYWYTWNSSYHQVQGTQARYGSNVEMRVSVSDASGRTAEARPNIFLTPFEQHDDSPYRCFGSSYCYAYRNDVVGKRGTQSFNW